MSLFLHRAGVMIPGALRARLVGSYTINFAGTSSATATIPIADLQYPATNARQVLVFVFTEAPTPLATLSIDGTVRPYFVNDNNTFIVAAGGTLTATANFNVVVGIASASSEIGRIVLYEVENAQPLCESFRCGMVEISATTLPYFITVPVGGIAVGAALGFTDTSSFTWSGILTEDLDLDAGDYRITSASALTPQQSVQRASSTISNTVDVPVSAIVGVSPLSASFVRGGSTVWRALGSANPMTAVENLTSSSSINRGNYKLLAVVSTQSDATITSMTYGLGAMTQIASARNTAASLDLQIEVWAIDVVNNNFNGNIVINWSGVPGAAVLLQTYDLYGVGSVGTPQSITGNATGAAVSVDVAQGGCILAFHLRDDAFPITITGVDKRTLLGFGGNASISGERFICSAETGRSVQAIGSLSSEYVTLAIPFNP